MNATAPTAPILTVRGLTKRYGERVALRDVSFDVSPGELVAIVGPNGAGKTTLLSIVAGVQRASAGDVGGAATDGGGGRGAQGRGARGGDRGARGHRAIGWAPQQPALYGKLSVIENLRLFARLEDVADPEAAVARMLTQTGLSARAHELVERLSGGNRQRVNVALGLLSEPRLLALDEPSSALDPGQRERLWELVGALARGGTSVLFSTHHLGEVRRHATRAIVLADGELLFDGPPAALVAANGISHGDEADFEGAFVTFLKAHGH